MRCLVVLELDEDLKSGRLRELYTFRYVGFDEMVQLGAN